MSKVAVIYKSKYGSTKQYAEWIAEELSADLLEAKKVRPEALLNYETLVFGGGLYAGGVSGISLLKKNFEKFKNKRLIVFTCGLADTEMPLNIEHIQKTLSTVFTPEEREKIKFFHLRGAIDYTKLSFIHKLMMSMMHKMILKKPIETRTTEDEDFLSSYGKQRVFTDKKNIAVLLSFVQHL